MNSFQSNTTTAQVLPVKMAARASMTSTGFGVGARSGFMECFVKRCTVTSIEQHNTSFQSSYSITLYIVRTLHVQVHVRIFVGF